jgi:hypothetical protein
VAAVALVVAAADSIVVVEVAVLVVGRTVAEVEVARALLLLPFLGAAVLMFASPMTTLLPRPRALLKVHFHDDVHDVHDVHAHDAHDVHVHRDVRDHSVRDVFDGDSFSFQVTRFVFVFVFVFFSISILIFRQIFVM